MGYDPKFLFLILLGCLVGGLLSPWLKRDQRDKSTPPAPNKNQLFARVFCDELNRMREGFQQHGDAVIGPDGLCLYFDDIHHGDSPQDYPGHIDIDIVFEENNAETVRILDCVTGFGSDIEEKAKNAAKIWIGTTGASVLEFKYSRQGEFASHFNAGEPDGLHGWHIICSPLLGYGSGPAARLQKWWVDGNKVLPAIAPKLKDLIDEPHGIKVFFGHEDIAEVRVDGELHEAASEVLAHLDWPRDTKACLRAYIIAIHRG